MEVGFVAEPEDEHADRDGAIELGSEDDGLRRLRRTGATLSSLLEREHFTISSYSWQIQSKEHGYVSRASH